jgi:hypothetical protein
MMAAKSVQSCVLMAAKLAEPSDRLRAEVSNRMMAWMLLVEAHSLLGKSAELMERWLLDLVSLADLIASRGKVCILIIWFQ